AHRQRIVNWINATGGTSSAFDITTKGILHSALHNEYWRMIDPQGKPTGVMGWWPSRAVTFLENHDTGSTQVCDMFLFLSKYDAININIGDYVDFIPLEYHLHLV
ncbi:rootletin-like, partial [Trifolium medium]|nr:rootletin-like [Trifolium medium]